MLVAAADSMHSVVLAADAVAAAFVIAVSVFDYIDLWPGDMKWCLLPPAVSAAAAADTGCMRYFQI